MYTKRMHEEIRRIAKENYGREIRTDKNWPVGRTLTFAAICELLDKIEELQEELGTEEVE